MRRSERLGRLALIPLGLLIAVLALEVLLQIGAQVVRATGPGPSSWKSRETGSRRVLCLGDSNTYGVWLKDRETEAWPPQLESLWNGDGPARPIDVLNAGYPGTNSSRLLGDFPDLLEALEPELVIAMVGVNDWWTEPVPLVSQDGGFSSLVRHSRVLRLAQLLEPRIQNRPIGDRERGGDIVRFGEHEFDMRWQKAPPGHGADWHALERNLRHMADLARDRGVSLVSMTYPSSHDAYGRANVAIRAAAGEPGATLIDLAEVFRPLCPREACPEWLYRDQHPRARGYRLVAETIVARLQENAP